MTRCCHKNQDSYGGFADWPVQYVHATVGSDANGGARPDKAKATIEAAYGDLDADGAQSGIQLRETGTRVLVGIFGDGTTSFNDQHPTAMSNNTIHEAGYRVDRTAEELEVFLDGAGSGTPTDLTGAGSALGGNFDIGRVSTTYLGNGDVLALAIWVGTALSDADIATAGEELQEPVTPSADSSCCGCRASLSQCTFRGF